MGGVEAVVLRGYRGECDQLIRLGIGAGHLHQSRRDSYRAFLHGRSRKRLHPAEFLGRGRTVFLTQLVNADGGSADEGGHVGRYASRLQVLEVFGQRGPSDVVRQVIASLLHVLPDRLVHGSHRTALAHDFERDALIDVAPGTTIDHDGLLRVAHHVDKPGSDGQSARIDFRLGSVIGELTNGGYRIAADSDISLKRRATASVVDQAVTKDDIVLRRSRTRGAENQSRNSPRQQASMGKGTFIQHCGEVYHAEGAADTGWEDAAAGR